MNLSLWERRLGKCESPIERLFLDAFCPMAIEQGYEVQKRSSAKEGVIVVKLQEPIGSYRADFLISYPFFGAKFAVVVECDGHNFHERTRAQAAHDRRRDRYMQKAGYEVYRFTGSEITASPNICAKDVLDSIMEFQTSVIEEAMRPPSTRRVA